MFRKLLAALLLLAPFPALADVTFWWGCESTTLGADDFSAADTTATANGSITISSSSPLIGANSCLTVDGTDYFHFAPTSILSSSAGSMSALVRYAVAYPGSSREGPLVGVNSGSTNNNVGFNQGASAEISTRLRNPTGGGAKDVITTAANLAIDTTYCLVGRWHVANDDMRIEVYDSSGNLIEAVEDLATDLSTFEPSGIDQIRVGNPNASVNPLRVDNVRVSQEYGEELQDHCFDTSYKPTFTSTSVGTITTTTIPIDATSDQTGAMTWVACPNGQTASRAQVLAHNCSGGAAAAFFDENVVRNVADGGTLSGLSPGTTYDVFGEQTSSIGGPGAAQASFPDQTTASAGTPAFDDGPEVSAQTTVTYTIDYDASAVSNDIFCGCYPIDATAPTGAQLEAGTGATGTATEVVTGSADSIDLTCSESDKLPKHDLYCVLEDTGVGYSTVGAMPDEFLDTPAGRQYVSVSGSPEVGQIGLFDGASPAIADGDVMDVSEHSDSFDSGPAAHDIVVNANTTFRVVADKDADGNQLEDTDLSRNLLTRRFHDISVGAWSDASAVQLAVNNKFPAYVGPVEDDTPYLYEKNATCSDDLRVLFTDDEGDDITVTMANVPSGGSVTASVLDCSFDTYGHYPLPELTAEDIIGDQTDQVIQIVVGFVVPDLTAP